MNSLWDILSVAIGISFIFMILSILNSWIQDYISNLFNLRANNLADVLQNLLEPGAEKLNGIERARTAFKTLGKADEARIVQLLKGGAERLRKASEKNRGWGAIGAALERLGSSTERMYQQRTVQERIAQLDSEHKAAGIADLLFENPVRTLYMHPVVYSLSKPGELPDYLPNKDFAVALLDLLDDAGRGEAGKSSPSSKLTMSNIKKGIARLEEIGLEKLKENGEKGLETEDNQLGYRLRSLLYTAQINAKGKAQAGIEEFQDAVSEWFEDTVNRGRVWYKTRMQRIGIVCGLLLAILLNADTIGLSNALWHNAMLRESISQAAEASAAQGQAPDSDQTRQQLDELISLGLPIGWSFDATPGNPRAFPTTTGGWVSKGIGLLLTGFAISQGSQIWFDLMNRLLNLRSAGGQPASGDKTDKDKGRAG